MMEEGGGLHFILIDASPKICGSVFLGGEKGGARV